MNIKGRKIRFETGQAFAIEYFGDGKTGKPAKRKGILSCKMWMMVYTKGVAVGRL